MDNNNVINRREVHWEVEGKYVTDMARRLCFEENKFHGAVDLLMSCLVTDELTYEERVILALKILNGNAEIVGRYPNEDYGVEDTDSQTPVTELFKFFDKTNEKLKEKEKEIKEWQEKFLFLAEYLAEEGDWKLREVNREYRNAFDEELFDLGKEQTTTRMENSMLESFLDRMSSDSSDDYGWLETDGTFHPVEWGDHEKWASEWLKANKPFSEFAELYWLEQNGERQHITGGDVLVFKLHWVLLHNPFQGIAEPKYDMTRTLTKAQKEFLFDYYIERGKTDKANALFVE